MENLDHDRSGQFATAHDSLFEPGAEYHYSDTDYLVLGLLINRVTGHSTSHEITNRILQPLGLRHTELPGTDPRIPGGPNRPTRAAVTKLLDDALC